MTTTPKLVADDIERLCKRLEAPIGYGGQNSEDGYEIHDKLRLEAAAALRRLAAEAANATQYAERIIGLNGECAAAKALKEVWEARATAAEANYLRVWNERDAERRRAEAAEARVSGLETLARKNASTMEAQRMRFSEMGKHHGELDIAIAETRAALDRSTP
jgi:predicted ATPase